MRKFLSAGQDRFKEFRIYAEVSRGDSPVQHVPVLVLWYKPLFTDDMSPRRPRSHVNADRSIARITQALLSFGWSVEELYKDYGEDLLVRIFEQEQATQYSFFVQAKSTTNIARYTTTDGRYIRYPFDPSHLDHWGKFWEPVVAMIWDSLNDITYWELVQSPEKSSDTTGTHPGLYIPTDNVLDADGLARIASRTKRRHKRFEQEQEGAKVLIEMLEEMLDVKIDYGPQNGFLIITKASGEMQVTAFGRGAERIRELEKLTGRSAEEILNRSITSLRELVDADGKVVERDTTGNVVREWATVNDYLRHIERETELKDN